jgi:hypothetical protein
MGTTQANGRLPDCALCGTPTCQVLRGAAAVRTCATCKEAIRATLAEEMDRGGAEVVRLGTELQKSPDPATKEEQRRAIDAIQKYMALDRPVSADDPAGGPGLGHRAEDCALCGDPPDVILHVVSQVRACAFCRPLLEQAAIARRTEQLEGVVAALVALPAARGQAGGDVPERLRRAVAAIERWLAQPAPAAAEQAAPQATPAPEERHTSPPRRPAVASAGRGVQP